MQRHRSGSAVASVVLALALSGCGLSGAGSKPSPTPSKGGSPTPASAAATSTTVAAIPTTIAGTPAPGALTPAAAGTALEALQAALTRTAAEVSPKVVVVRSAAGLGSGDILDPRGYIVTNYHVLTGKNRRLAPPFRVGLSNGQVYRATVTGVAPQDDLAVLKINAGTLKPMALGDSSRLQVGQVVLAVGNPLGYAQTVTFGIISTLGRGLSESRTTFLPDLIQTSAPINPGNSGGALVDLDGRLIGIPTLGAVDPAQGTAAQGIGFAIPVNRVRFIADQLIKSGKVTNSGRATLGVTTLEVTPQAQAQYNLPVDHGLYIYRITRGGAAARAGLRRGQIIVAMDGKAINGRTDLLDALAQHSAGQKVKLDIVKPSGAHATVTVTLGPLPAPRPPRR